MLVLAGHRRSALVDERNVRRGPHGRRDWEDVTLDRGERALGQAFGDARTILQQHVLQTFQLERVLLAFLRLVEWKATGGQLVVETPGSRRKKKNKVKFLIMRRKNAHNSGATSSQ